MRGTGDVRVHAQSSNQCCPRSVQNAINAQPGQTERLVAASSPASRLQCEHRLPIRAPDYGLSTSPQSQNVSLRSHVFPSPAPRCQIRASRPVIPVSGSITRIFYVCLT